MSFREAPMEVEMKIRGLMMDPVTNMPIVVLKDAQGTAVLPIWVGKPEASSINFAMTTGSCAFFFDSYTAPGLVQNRLQVTGGTRYTGKRDYNHS